MSIKQEEYTIKWENTKSFEFIAKETGIPQPITIVKVEENADLATIWEDISRAVTKYFAGRLKKIGDEMVS